MIPKCGVWCGLGIAPFLLGCATVAEQPQAMAHTGSVSETKPRQVLDLWNGAAPGTPASWIEPEYTGVHSVTYVTRPTLTVFLPDTGTATGAAMIVAPGGGFTGLSIHKEGYRVGQWLSDRGVTAFVLKYRVRPFDAIGERRDPQPDSDGEDLQGRFEPNMSLAKADGLQAMRMVRSRAEEFGIDGDRLGFMGFSAGAMTAMNVTFAAEPDERPDFVVPIYGAMPDKEVPDDAPPAFVVVARDDFLFEKSVDLFNRWSKANRPIEFHVYERGGHGFGMDKQGMPIDHWLMPFEAWLIDHGVIRTKIG